MVVSDEETTDDFEIIDRDAIPSEPLGHRLAEAEHLPQHDQPQNSDSLPQCVRENGTTASQTGNENNSSTVNKNIVSGENRTWIIYQREGENLAGKDTQHRCVVHLQNRDEIDGLVRKINEASGK